MSFTGPVPSVAKAVVPFLHASLLAPLTREEKLGVEVLRAANSRQVLKIDVYEAKGLCKFFSIETFFELCELYRERREEYEYSTASEEVEPASASFQKDLQKALFSETKSSNILRLLEYLVSEALMLSEAREELRRAIEMVEEEQARAEHEAEVTAAATVAAATSSTAEAAEQSPVVTANDAGVGEASTGTMNTNEQGQEAKYADWNDQQETKAVTESKDSDCENTRFQEQAGDTFITDSKDVIEGNGEQKRGEHGTEAIGAVADEHEKGKDEQEEKTEKEEKSCEVEKAPAASPRTASEHPSAVVYAKECKKYGIPVSAIFTKCVESASALLNFSHYGLSEEGLNAVTTALRTYNNLTSLNLADNWIGPEGTAIVCTYVETSSLVSLDLGKNNIGLEGIGCVADAVTKTKYLKIISLAENELDDAAGVYFLENGIAKNRSITRLDLSRNLLGNDTAIAIGRLLLRSKSLAELSLRWNNIRGEGVHNLAHGIKHNKVLSTIDLGWNMIESEGGFAMAEAIASSISLRRVDLSQNGIGADAGVVIAEAVRSSALTALEMQENPIGTVGGSALLFAQEHSTTLKHVGLAEITADPNDDARPAFDLEHPSGFYTLDLSHFKDHSIAEVLLKKAVRKEGKWTQASYNGAPFTLNVRWKIPDTGKLNLTFQASPSVAAARQNQLAEPSVHFKLDLSVADERKVAQNLINRAIKEPGENWRNETFNGSSFNFDEKNETWLDDHRRGILELDYVSSKLRHEAHYSLDLAVRSEHSICLKLLDRVFKSRQESKSEGQEDQIANATLDGSAFSLRRWEITTARNADGLFVSDASRYRARSSKSMWRVPHRGVLELDYITRNPQHVFTHHFVLDLSSSVERDIAIKMKMASLNRTGENWWNEMIDGLPINFGPDAEALHEIMTDSNWARMPHAGILTFDYVVTKNKEQHTKMVKDHYSLDLTDEEERDKAKLLRQRAANNVDEFWLNVSIRDAHGKTNRVSAKRVMMPELAWETPFTGTLNFDFVSFRDHDALEEGQFQRLLGEVRERTSDTEKLEVIELAAKAGDHFTSSQAKDMLETFGQHGGEEREALHIVAPLLVDAHNANTIAEVLHDRDDRRALRNWTLKGVWR